MHRKSIDDFKRTRVKLEVFFMSLAPLSQIFLLSTMKLWISAFPPRVEREVTGNFWGAVHQSAACKASYAKQANIKDADVRAGLFRIVNACHSYWPTGETCENKTSGCDYPHNSHWSGVGGAHEYRCQCREDTALRTLVHCNRYSLCFHRCSGMQRASRAAADQTKSDETWLTLAVASLMDRLSVCSCSWSLQRKKHKSRIHDIAGEVLKAIYFCVEVSGEINKRQWEVKLPSYTATGLCVAEKRKFLWLSQKEIMVFRGCTDQKLHVEIRKFNKIHCE